MGTTIPVRWIVSAKRRVRIDRSNNEEFVLFVGHRPVNRSIVIWPFAAAFLLSAVALQPSHLLSYGTLGVVLILTAFWLRDHFGGDCLNIGFGEISLTRGFGLIKTTTNFRLCDIESIGFYTASRNPRAEATSCIGISARQWVLPLGLASGVEREEAIEILQQMKSVAVLAPKIKLTPM